MLNLLGLFKGVILGPVFNILKNPKYLVIMLIVTFVAAVLWKFNSLENQVTAALNANSVLTDANAKLKVSIDELQEVNLNNEKILDDYKKMKMEADEKVTDLLKEIDSSNKTYNPVINSIRNTPPSQDGTISKVLFDTIQTISNKRNSK